MTPVARALAIFLRLTRFVIIICCRCMLEHGGGQQNGEENQRRPDRDRRRRNAGRALPSGHLPCNLDWHAVLHRLQCGLERASSNSVRHFGNGVVAADFGVH